MKERPHHMKKSLQRVGAVGLAAATIVTGLSFGPAAAVAAPPTSAESATTDRVSTPFVFGRWAIHAPASNAAGQLTWSQHSTYLEAAAAAGTWSLPSLGTSGRISQGDKCVYAPGVSTGNDQRLMMTSCSAIPAGSVSTFTLTTEGKLSAQGGVVAGTVRGDDTWLSLTSGGNPGWTVTGEATGAWNYLDHVTSYDATDDSVTLTITGTVRNANVYLEDMDGGNGNGGSARTDQNGNATIKLSAGLGAGERIRVKYWQDGLWQTKATSRAAAPTDVTVDHRSDGSIVVSGTAATANADIYVSPGRLTAEAVQIEKAKADRTFSFVLNDAAADLGTAFIFNRTDGVRSEIAINELSGKVDSVDIPNRTAQISGTAIPRAFVVINGEDQVQAGSDGTWSRQLTGLKLGSNPVTLEQYQNGTKTGTTTIDAELEVVPVTGAVSFPDDLGQDAVLSGTAHPGATIVVRDVDGDEIARTDARLGSGAWSTPITAPDAGGDYDLRVHQEIDDEATGEVIVTAPYGAAVAITAPVDGMAHDGGPVTLQGTGEIGAQVAVREQGRTTVLGTAEVLQSGRWTIRTTNVDDRKHVLEATQTGKGDNTTRSTVTLNPEAGEAAPVTVTNPADATAGYVPNTSFTFEGTGTAGKTLQVENKFGTTLGTARVEDDRTWSWTRANMGTSTWTINFIQDKGETTQSTATVLNFKPSAETPAPAPLVTVTNPSDAKEGYVPNTSFTFEGTGTADKTIQVENKFGTTLGTTTVRPNSTWSWTRANMGTSIWTINFIQDKGTPSEAKAQVANFAPTAETPAPAPVVTVTNPADAKDGYVPNTGFTFEGSATAGKTLQVENKFGTSLGTAPVRPDSTWSWTRANMGTSTWSINFIQDKGTETEEMAQVVDFKPRG